MGLFVLCLEEDPTPKDLIETAMANIELHLEHDDTDYLLEAFALPMLKEALEKLEK